MNVLAKRVALMSLCALVVAERATYGSVVYDSVSGSVANGGLGFIGSVEIGQGITLEGSSRRVTQVDLLLGTSTPAHEFQLRFYKLDGNMSEPETLIWQSPIQINPFTPASFRKIVSVEVPGVVVPDTFAWVVVSIPPNSGTFLVGSSDPPTVGTHLDIWRRRLDLSWQTFNEVNTGVFGARVVAIPEPDSLLLIVIAVATVKTASLRRRKSH